MTNAIVPVLTKRELAESRLYPNIKTPAQAAVVMARAKSYGMCATTVADGIYFVSGKPAMSAQLIASLVKRSDKYDFRVRVKTDKEASIEFFEVTTDGKRESLGVETFTIAMAQRAGLASGANWKKFPEAMLWARCLTAGVRARCSDALGGSPVYSVEELSPTTEVDSEGRPMIEGEVLDAEIVPSESSTPPAKVVEEIESLISRTNTDIGRFLAFHKVASVSDLTGPQREDALSGLRAKLEAMPSADVQ